mmetsp:Transcript_17501/g.31783  ORF Transcript_17501/g.31783 Transcript_17501/m.31783 type:complete len:259 (+) Transcript_17501:1760-2536(+)
MQWRLGLGIKLNSIVNIIGLVVRRHGGGNSEAKVGIITNIVLGRSRVTVRRASSSSLRRSSLRWASTFLQRRRAMTRRGSEVFVRQWQRAETNAGAWRRWGFSTNVVVVAPAAAAAAAALFWSKVFVGQWEGAEANYAVGTIMGRWGFSNATLADDEALAGFSIVILRVAIVIVRGSTVRSYTTAANNLLASVTIIQIMLLLPLLLPAVLHPLLQLVRNLRLERHHSKVWSATTVVPATVGIAFGLRGGGPIPRHDGC